MEQKRGNGKHKWWAWALGGLAVVALVVLYFWLEKTGRLGIFSSSDEFRAWLAQFGAWAPLIFFLLQTAQVVVAFIPGEVTGVAGGLLFGFWNGIILSILGVTAGSMIAFAIARKLGRPAVVRLAGGSASVDKYMAVVEKNSIWLLFSMFLLPFFPKDTLCYVAGLTGVAWPVFLLLSSIGRLPGQIVSTLVGSGMITVPIWGWAVILLASGGFVFLSFRYSEKIGDWLMGRMRRKG